MSLAVTLFWWHKSPLCEGHTNKRTKMCWLELPIYNIKDISLQRKILYKWITYFIILWKRSLLHIKSMLHHLIFLSGWGGNAAKIHLSSASSTIANSCVSVLGIITGKSEQGIAPRYILCPNTYRWKF